MTSDMGMLGKCRVLLRIQGVALEVALRGVCGVKVVGADIVRVMEQAALIPAISIVKAPVIPRNDGGFWLLSLGPNAYLCLTDSKLVAVRTSAKSAGSKLGSSRGPMGQTPSWVYIDEAMALSHMKL